MIRARIISGLDRVRAQGKQLGRPRTAAETAIEVALLNGLGIRAIARQFGVGTATVRRVGREPRFLEPCCEGRTRLFGV